MAAVAGRAWVREGVELGVGGGRGEREAHDDWDVAHAEENKTYRWGARRRGSRASLVRIARSGNAPRPVARSPARGRRRKRSVGGAGGPKVNHSRMF